jgi:hypothetical protein
VQIKAFRQRLKIDMWCELPYSDFVISFFAICAIYELSSLSFRYSVVALEGDLQNGKCSSTSRWKAGK